MDDTRGLRIHFIDGTTTTFEFPLQGSNSVAREMLAEELLAKRMIVVEAGGELHFIPLDNVRSFCLFPAPETPGKSVIRGAAVVR
jgi:hypothetical protein